MKAKSHSGQPLDIIIAPGAFKGSLSQRAAAQAIDSGLKRSGLPATTIMLPLADGGDGTLDAFLSTGGQRVTVDTFDALYRPIKAAYGLLDDGITAVIELAQASGLAQIRRADLDAMRASTYGTGMLMQAALEAGARRFIIGLGGSATTDGAAGALQALGVRFTDERGRKLMAGGGVLRRIHHIDTSGLDPRWQSCEIILATDVTNAALGPNGAAHVFARQKGASDEEIELLETGLTHYFTQIERQHGVDVREAAGGGAAGAAAAGLLALLPARIESGVNLVLQHLRFDEHLEHAALLITGEGQIDGQTLGGKGPLGVALRARERGVPTIALVGGLNADEAVLHEAGIWSILPIVSRPMTLEDAVHQAPQLLEQTALRLGYLLQLRL